MRLTLVDNFIMPDGLDPAFFDVHPHLGLTSLAAVAQPEGHEVVIYDPKREVRFGRRAYDKEFYQHAARDILGTAPEAIGFTTLGCSFLFAVRVAALIKLQEPEIPILLGGPHATMLDRPILEAYDQFDVVVRSEAEHTLLPVLAGLERRAFEGVPGITWRTGCRGEIRSTPGLPKIEDLDQLPIPLYELYPIHDLGLTLMRVEAGRGCPFNCTFCSTAAFFQRSYRLKSPERIVREMDLLYARYGITEFKLDHDLFTVDRRKVRAFCEAVQDRNYRWRASARTDCIDEPLLEAMALAGCIGLYFGIETGSQRMQSISQKRLKLEGVDSILNLTESFGIESTVSFITGYPEEEREDQDATLDMLGTCFQRSESWCLPQLHILLPEPGTPMFAQRAQLLEYDGYVTRFNARLLKEDDRGHILKHPDLYATYFYYPAAMPRAEYTFAVDSVDAFRVVGHDILSYALRFFDGRLSRLIASFRKWMREKYPVEAVRPALTLEFIADTAGPNHHLTSLFRFGVVIETFKPDGAQRPTKFPESEPEASTRVLYQLSPQIRVLPDMHDCGVLLEQIRCLPPGAGPLDDAQAGHRTCHLVVTTSGKSTHYHLDCGTESVLSLFEFPRTLNSASALLRYIDPGAPDQRAFLDELVRIRALVPADRRDSANGTTDGRL